MLAPAGFEVLFILERGERIEVTGTAEIEVASVAAISAAGSPPGDKFFPSEGHATIPAIPCFNLDFGVINEHRKLFVCWLVCSYDVDEPASVAPILKLDGSTDFREEGVILSTANV